MGTITYKMLKFLKVTHLLSIVEVYKYKNNEHNKHSVLVEMITLHCPHHHATCVDVVQVGSG